MPGEEGLNWLYRPLMQKLCGYESYINGALSLEDIAIMNDIIDVEAYNQRAYAAHVKGGGT